ncbi:angiomotin-like 2a isoform X4 [Schistocerca nitens]|uniref:angiomotin-like 2a isoform X4 n=1 Tax=Schistocerca nitens TaxID=7011 RepID=UPI002117A5D4|nr:angiomotin-like 2a isoform X4 [Schistocerca nitens]
MLINLVKDSVLQCFCHTCRAPLPAAAHRRSAPIKKAKNKPRSKQPKKVKFITTEIRCQERSKGGLAYEVILADPVTDTPPKRPTSPKSTSAENIEEKLKAAEERRMSLEANKMAALAAKMSKIEEASRKKDEQANTFILQTREALEQKMETHVEKREAYINDLKAKLKDHLESVEKTRLSLEQQTNEVKSAVEEKLKTAAAQRDENIKKMLDRLREHERRAEMVRQNKERLSSQSEEQHTASSG